MSILEVRTFGDPVLFSVADEVKKFDGKLKTLIADMVETMVEVEGVGLAAPQVGVGLRLFTYHVDGEIGHVINPKLEVDNNELQYEHEGCLSAPSLSYATPRPKFSKVTGFNQDGNEIEVSGAGLMARVLQHECDHLDGKLFISRLEKDNRKDAMQKLRKGVYDAKSNVIKRQRSNAVSSSFFKGA
ncbi:MAG: peptide deformylase [Micrococcaceae bacterium]